MALLCVFSVAVIESAALAQSVSVSRPGARGSIYNSGLSYPRARAPAVSTGAPAARSSTVNGTLKGPVGDHVITDGPITRTPVESRFVDVDDVLLILALAPSCARLAILAAALPRLADVQRFDELVAAFGDASQQRQAQALVDESQ